MSERRITRGVITDRKDLDLHATILMNRLVDHDYDKLTGRDQFAMAALTGLLARQNYDKTKSAGYAYKYADEMLKARKK